MVISETLSGINFRIGKEDLFGKLLRHLRLLHICQSLMQCFEFMLTMKYIWNKYWLSSTAVVHLNLHESSFYDLLPLADIVSMISLTVLSNSTTHSFLEQELHRFGWKWAANSHNHIEQHISSSKRLIPRPTHWFCPLKAFSLGCVFPSLTKH